jgi:hypothetical protein
MLEAPVFAGVRNVEAKPLSSATEEQALRLAQMESAVPLLAFQPMEAPATAVIPSPEITRTRIGLVAWVPTGVKGLEPCSRTIASVGAAPYVRAPVMVENEPVAGSEMVKL